MPKILVIAQVTWRELVRSRALWAFVAGALVLGGLPLAVAASAGQDAAGLSGLADICCHGGWSLATGALTYIAAGSVAREVGMRTLPSTMVRPVSAWQFLGGRALAHLALYSSFAALTLGLAWAVLTAHGGSLSGAVLWHAAASWCRAAMWVGIAVPLGGITSGAFALSVFSLLWLQATVADKLGPLSHPVWATLDTLLWALGPATAPEDFGLLAALCCLENLGFAALVLAACAWAWERRDTPLRS